VTRALLTGTILFSLNHGQTCCSGSRIFVHSSIYDEFLKRFTEETKSLKFGDQFALDSKQGPQVSKVQFDVSLCRFLVVEDTNDSGWMQRIMGEISQAKSQGAKVHLGGERHGTQGYWIQPTIITDTRPEMRIVKDEIFGPIAVVIKFTDEKDVLDAEETSMQGLTASFFTKDLTHGVEVANKLQAGTVWVNCMNTLYPNVPFGGYRQSGIGRECGQYALDTCVVHT
jgi:aldehyde dehydrogenase (NAD+)